MLPLPVRDGLLGLLVLACPQQPSRQARGALEALANQLALALEGARLTEEIHAQRSEARFASLVQNSSDLITVVGADATITYQSPSSEHVLGYTPARAARHALRPARRRGGRGRACCGCSPTARPTRAPTGR